jgi:anti-sigma regulatory factor (Ser/Thr protein kinase)
MTELGRNPGRIISAWVDFVQQHAGAIRIRGIGEPVWPGRSHEEIVECQRHEALLNLAFADQSGFELLCPYDSARLDEAVLGAARHSHPLLTLDSELTANTQYVHTVAPFDGSLPDPPEPAESLDLAEHHLLELRHRVAAHAVSAGVDPARVKDLVLAVNEAATNSLRHAGGHGSLRMWPGTRDFVCEVRDRGWIQDPLAGRLPVATGAPTGRGLWLIHQLCDLVQIRSSAAGNVVRMHMYT